VKILVDTSIWSLALRRAKRIVDDRVPLQLAELVREGRVAILGPIRQELLSGIKSRTQFEKLRDHLRAFPDMTLDGGDYEQAAEFFNRCRERGIQGSNTDSLICAAAVRRDFAIFTADRDFLHFARALTIKLYHPPSDYPGT
jgi:predicted nucleic acid-binding protein